MSAAAYTLEDLYSLWLPRQHVSSSVYSSLSTLGLLRRRHRGNRAGIHRHRNIQVTTLPGSTQQRQHPVSDGVNPANLVNVPIARDHRFPHRGVKLGCLNIRSLRNKSAAVCDIVNDSKLTFSRLRSSGTKIQPMLVCHPSCHRAALSLSRPDHSLTEQRHLRLSSTMEMLCASLGAG